jgi:hypothetical protein
MQRYLTSSIRFYLSNNLMLILPPMVAYKPRNCGVARYILIKDAGYICIESTFLCEIPYMPCKDLVI